MYWLDVVRYNGLPGSPVASRVSARVVPMGIRFLCHHCEKRLNVKTNQAGQAGQCPFCMESIMVPLESKIPSQFNKLEQLRHGRERDDAEPDSLNDLHSVEEQVTSVGMPAEMRHGQGVRPPAAKQPVGSNEFDFHDSNNSLDVFMLDKPAPPNTLGKIDPIAEAPDRVWYFRSRKLGEKGPLKAKAMQSHLDSGDVAIGCIVWRDDWEDWAPAEKVFPSLVAEAKSRRKKARVKRAFKDANYQIPEELDPKSSFNRRRRRKNMIFASAIAAGVVVILVLVFVLAKLLSN
jgi:hypothetical protein